MTGWHDGYDGPPTPAAKRLIEQALPVRIVDTPAERNRRRYANALLLLEYGMIRGRVTDRTGATVVNLLGQMEVER